MCSPEPSRQPATALPLADADANLPGIQAECSVTQNLPCDTFGSGSCRATGYEATAIRQCRDNQGDLLDVENPQPDKVSSESRPCWYLHRDVSEFGCTKTPWSLSALVLTRKGELLPPGSLLEMSCMTCPDGQAGCQAEH